MKQVLFLLFILKQKMLLIAVVVLAVKRYRWDELVLEGSSGLPLFASLLAFSVNTSQLETGGRILLGNLEVVSKADAVHSSMKGDHLRPRKSGCPEPWSAAAFGGEDHQSRDVMP